MPTDSRQCGLALITAMLVVAIAATTAAFLSLDQQIWLRQAQNIADRTQGEVVRGAALDWAVTILEKDANDSKSDDLTEDWAKPLPPLQVEGGQVAGQIADAQGLFNLNSLVRNNAPSAADIGTFQHLLQTLTFDPNLTDAVIDWIDNDNNARPYGAEDSDYLQLKTPYRAANQLLQSVEELRLIRGFTPEIVKELRPWVTVLPQATEINVNTAPKEVLEALFYSLPPSAVEDIISERPYTDVAKVSSKIQEAAGGKNIPKLHYTISSSYFDVTVETLFGRYRRTTQGLIQRATDGGASRVLWHGQRMTTVADASETPSDEKADKSSGGEI